MVILSSICFYSSGSLADPNIPLSLAYGEKGERDGGIGKEGPPNPPILGIGIPKALVPGTSNPNGIEGGGGYAPDGGFTRDTTSSF